MTVPDGTRGPLIAIDGPSGSGKSTVARGVAAALRLPHVDTGALYRAVTLAVLRRGADAHDAEACAAIARDVHVTRDHDRTFLDGEDVEDEIRGPEVTAAVSAVSAHPGVREALVPVQRAAASDRGAVVEGRDIGTVVFPGADVKLWITASPDERARRRAEQLRTTDASRVARDLALRDAQDQQRPVAPMARAEDAWEVDTTGMSADETVDALAALVRALLEERGLAPAPSGPGAGGTGQATAPRAPGDALPQRVPAPRTHPVVVVAGRPNVGKSTLVNRILGQRTAIVERRPGVTRDRTEHLARWRDRWFLVTDTGGWEQTAEGLGALVARQAETALAAADLVLFVVDATVGVQEDDERYARALRRAGTPVLLVANKVDGERLLPYVHELHALGLGAPHPVSALHGRGVGDLLDEVVERLPPATEEPADADDVTSVAVVGRPNVGKSSLFNALVGEERVLVDPVPHTTRDAVDTSVLIDGERWRFVDTAGLRRRYRRGEDTELYSVDRTRDAIAAADIALFVIDGSEPVAEQDQRLAAEIRDAGRGIVLAVNKWDLVDAERREDLERELDRLLGFARWAPRVNISALSGRGLDRLLAALRDVGAAFVRRVPTGELNRWLAEVTAATPPPPQRGRPVRIRYVTQASVGPPTFVAFSSGPLASGYRRYLERTLRERYDFTGTPLRIEVRTGGGRGPG